MVNRLSPVFAAALFGLASPAYAIDPPGEPPITLDVELSVRFGMHGPAVVTPRVQVVAPLRMFRDGGKLVLTGFIGDPFVPTDPAKQIPIEAGVKLAWTPNDFFTTGSIEYGALFPDPGKREPGYYPPDHGLRIRTPMWRLIPVTPTYSFLNGHESRFYLQVNLKGAPRESIPPGQPHGPFDPPLVPPPEFFNFYAMTMTVLPGVPEPGTWAMLILGFGLVGVQQRRLRMLPV